jgi:hypothetical protein
MFTNFAKGTASDGFICQSATNDCYCTNASSTRIGMIYFICFSWDNLPKATMVLETDYYFVWVI